MARKVVELDMMLTTTMGDTEQKKRRTRPKSFGISRSRRRSDSAGWCSAPISGWGSCAEDLQLHLSLVLSWSNSARFWDLCQKRCNTETTSVDDVVRGMVDAVHV